MYIDYEFIFVFINLKSDKHRLTYLKHRIYKSIFHKSKFDIDLLVISEKSFTFVKS